ncbi:ABC transporter permease [Streptomyces sp. NPDC058953]|uniref:ABC transporter permease n=1 Tax=unclassified Streptomyces TaxID=2593676 RepID=UPI0036CC9FF3
MRPPAKATSVTSPTLSPSAPTGPVDPSWARTGPPYEPPYELARRHGLTVSGERPTLPAYVRQLWARRHFITAFATARTAAQYSQAQLGRIWQPATPLLNAAVYYVIFGILLGTSNGVPDFVLFLITGLFIWTFTSDSIMAGARSVTGNIGLVRALHFPRASLPIALALQQFQQMLFSMAALTVILLGFGQVPGPSWLLAIPALALQTVFNTGAAMTMARIAARTPDITQLLPFVLRTWMYASGVMWSISTVLRNHDLPQWVMLGLQYNPVAVYIDLVRFALIDSYTASQLPPHVWAVALGWAVLLGVGGFMYFWKAEERYGRG